MNKKPTEETDDELVIAVPIVGVDNSIDVSQRITQLRCFHHSRFYECDGSLGSFPYYGKRLRFKWTD